MTNMSSPAAPQTVGQAQGSAPVDQGTDENENRSPIARHQNEESGPLLPNNSETAEQPQTTEVTGHPTARQTDESTPGSKVPVNSMQVDTTEKHTEQTGSQNDPANKTQTKSLESYIQRNTRAKYDGYSWYVKLDPVDKPDSYDIFLDGGSEATNKVNGTIIKYGTMTNHTDGT